MRKPFHREQQLPGIDLIVGAHLPLLEVMGMWVKAWWLWWEFWMDILGLWVLHGQHQQNTSSLAETCHHLSTLGPTLANLAHLDSTYFTFSPFLKRLYSTKYT